MLRRRRSKKRQLLWHSFASSFPSASFSLLSAPPLPLPSIGAADPVASKTAKTRNRREARRMWLRASKRERRKDDEEKKVKLAKERVEKKKKLDPLGLSKTRTARSPPPFSLPRERGKRQERRGRRIRTGPCVHLLLGKTSLSLTATNNEGSLSLFLLDTTAETKTARKEESTRKSVPSFCAHWKKKRGWHLVDEKATDSSRKLRACI